MREVRSDGRCYDLTGATKDKRVFGTRFEADQFLAKNPQFNQDQEAYPCGDAATLHYHLRTISKHQERNAAVEQSEISQATAKLYLGVPRATHEDAMDVRRKNVALAVAESEPVAEIAARLGVSKATIRKDIDYLGIKYPKVQSEREIRQEHVKTYYEQGATDSEMAKLLGASKATIRKDRIFLCLNEANRKTRTVHPRTGKRGNTALLEQINRRLELLCVHFGLEPKVVAAGA